MKLTLLDQLNQFLRVMQGELFPALEEELGPLTDKHQIVVKVLNLIQLEGCIGSWTRGVGRPVKDRRAIARAFVAKAVYNMSTTRQLLERLLCDVTLRRICGWESQREIPHESAFSRAFAEFAKSELPQRLHAGLIQETQKERLIGHISRDSTQIDAREKPQRAPGAAAVKLAGKKKGRPKKGESAPAPEPSRLERQADMTLEAMLADLPRACNVGSKRNSKGYLESWVGYKLHLDVADGQIPISCILTSASVHDSQVAIPLAETTALRVTHLYDLMDAAYDAELIRKRSTDLGHVPIIDCNPRRDTARKTELQAEEKRRKLVGLADAEDVRFHERTTVERVNGRLKDEFGAAMVRVRGNAKVMCHLMFGIVALTADQILRLSP